MLSDSVDLSSEVADDLLKFPAHIMSMVPFFLPFVASFFEVLVLLVPFLDFVLEVLASGLEVSHAVFDLGVMDFIFFDVDFEFVAFLLPSVALSVEEFASLFEVSVLGFPFSDGGLEFGDPDKEVS